MSKLLCLLITLSFLTSLAFANSRYAPQDFSQNEKKFIFVDMHTADYDIVYDISKKLTTARSKIVFEIFNEGHPLFDLNAKIQKIHLDNQEVNAFTVVLPTGSEMKAFNKKLAPGIYTAEIHHEFDQNVEYKTWFTKEVRSAFWMTDLYDRKYLEQYLPTNLEYDQMKMNLKITVVGADSDYTVRTNGVVDDMGSNEFYIHYPEFYTTSSIFFHLYPKGAFTEKEFLVKSIDGREISFQLYSKSSNTLKSLIDQTPKIFHELERDYGPWPHPHLIVYGAGSGGMEYVGATRTSLFALGHEMHHSYFARGMIPARGNDGWIDEALASWRDANYRQSKKDQLLKTQMSGHSPYSRITDRAAYKEGERIIGYLDQRFTTQGGLLPFLKDFAEKKMYQINTTEYFQKSLEDYFNTDLKDFFNEYIYGKGGTVKNLKPIENDNPYHKELTEEELLDLL